MKSGLVGALLLALAVEARAADGGAGTFRWQPEVSFISARPSARGVDAAIAWLTEPLEGRSIVAGPRLGILYAPSGQNGARTDVNTGLEAIAWVGNAVGPGLALDLVAPAWEGGADRSPRFSLRAVHRNSVSALRRDGGLERSRGGGL